MHSDCQFLSFTNGTLIDEGLPMNCSESKILSPPSVLRVLRRLRTPGAGKVLSSV
jgi:hypothetical protein